MPLFPLTTRALGTALSFGSIHAAPDPTTLALAAVLVSTCTFVISAAVLYRLAQDMTGSRAAAWGACIAHIASPATPFFTGGYSEALFCALTLTAALLLGRCVASYCGTA